MTPAKPTKTRAQASRRRRAETTHARREVARGRVRTLTSAPTLARARTGGATRAPARSKVRRRYQVAVPFVGSASLSLPSLHVHAGPRTISGAILVLTCGLLAMLWYMPPFIVEGAQVHGGLRLGASDINSVLGMAGKPIVTADTPQLEDTLRAAFPEIRNVSVRVGFPTGLIVTLTERTPLVAWQQGDKTLWLDAEGIAFPPRGTADGLITVKASGPPPAADVTSSSALPASTLPGTTVDVPGATTAVAQQLLTPDAVTALQAIAPYVPKDSALIYDPAYGLGWTDTRGWQAYFGQTISDLSLKLQMYQTLVDNLASRGIQPSLISVEYPDAPFYRAEQEQ